MPTPAFGADYHDARNDNGNRTLPLAAAHRHIAHTCKADVALEREVSHRLVLVVWDGRLTAEEVRVLDEQRRADARVYERILVVSPEMQHPIRRAGRPQ